MNKKFETMNTSVETEKFNKAVSKKGVDTSKPFEGSGGHKDIPDFSKEAELLRSEGIDLPE